MWHPGCPLNPADPRQPCSRPREGWEGRVILLVVTEGSDPWPTCWTHGSDLGLLRSGSQVKGEQTRLTELMALPAKNLEVQERKFCHKVHVLCCSGQGGLCIVCAVRSSGLIIVVISCVPEGMWFWKLTCWDETAKSSGRDCLGCQSLWGIFVP